MSLSALINLISCEVLSTNSNDSETDPVDSPDLIVQDSFLFPKGGDPRGVYAPNSPFVSYFGATEHAIAANSGTGILEIKGFTAKQGFYTVKDLRARIDGFVKDCPFTGVPLPFATHSGTWRVSGTKIIYTAEGLAGEDTTLFSGDDLGLYLLEASFTFTPPFLSFPGNFAPSCSGQTLWVFKK